MKLPTIIAATKIHIARDKSVVMQLVTTAESILDRRLGELSPEERAAPVIDLSPREYVIDYLERAFPTRQMRVYTDDTGTARSEPMVDDAGHPIHNPDAEQAKGELIEHLCALPPIACYPYGSRSRWSYQQVRLSAQPCVLPPPVLPRLSERPRLQCRCCGAAMVIVRRRIAPHDVAAGPPGAVREGLMT